MLRLDSLQPTYACYLLACLPTYRPYYLPSTSATYCNLLHLLRLHTATYCYVLLPIATYCYLRYLLHMLPTAATYCYLLTLNATYRYLLTYSL